MSEQGYTIKPLDEQWQRIDREFYDLCPNYPECCKCKNFRPASPNFCFLHPIWAESQIQPEKRNLTPSRLEKWYIQNRMSDSE